MRAAARRALFIAGAGTGIGKTYVTAALTRSLRVEGHAVLALKPVASGVPPIAHPDFASSDTGLLLAAQGLPITPETVEACSPWRFAAPLAPDLAAAREGRRLEFHDLVAWCRARLVDGIDTQDRDTRIPSHSDDAPQDFDPLWQTQAPPVIASGAKQPGDTRRSTTKAGLLRVARNDGCVGIASDAGRAEQFEMTLIEGVGGVMSPVTDDATGLDWLKALNIPVLLVSGSYLGAISHALTAAETLAARRIPLRAIVVSESEGAPVDPKVVTSSIARHTAVPVVMLRRGASDVDGLLDCAMG